MAVDRGEGGMNIPSEIHDAILDAHADCVERLALALARQPAPLGPESLQALDGYAALVGRENVPSEVWAAMSWEGR